MFVLMYTGIEQASCGNLDYNPLALEISNPYTPVDARSSLLDLLSDDSQIDQVASSTTSSDTENDNLTVEQCQLRSLGIGIWNKTRLDALSIAVTLDTNADFNFIHFDRLRELGYTIKSKDVTEYDGDPILSVCTGGFVYPIARVSLKWHHLSNSSIDYKDEFLVVTENLIGTVLGIRTIEKRVIYQKGPSFKGMGMRPVDKGGCWVILVSDLHDTDQDRNRAKDQSRNSC